MVLRIPLKSEIIIKAFLNPESVRRINDKTVILEEKVARLNSAFDGLLHILNISGQPSNAHAWPVSRLSVVYTSAVQCIMCRPMTRGYTLIHTGSKNIYSKSPAIGRVQAAKLPKVDRFCLHGQLVVSVAMSTQQVYNIDIGT